MAKVYGLFVGINQYLDPLTADLHGCVEDIEAITSLFTTHIKPPESLVLQTLCDGKATRDAIIAGFRNHLGQAQKDDVALFYYCGHGSYEYLPPEWKGLEASGVNQTIMPVDARTGEVFDIADKELSALIHEVSSGGAQVVVITDSCHSGGNTRGVDDRSGPGAGVARNSPAAQRTRTLNDYLPLARELYDPERIRNSGRPNPRHVAIAACQHDEIAKEFPKEPPPRRGAFSQAFEEAVRALGPSVTYNALVNAVTMKVRGRAAEQVPSLYVSGGASIYDVFLNGHAGRSDYTIDADVAGRWWMSAGAINGIPSPAQGHVTEVDIYADDAPDAPPVPPKPVATAVVVEVQPEQARLNLSSGGAPLDVKRQYRGAITRLGTPALHIVIKASAGAEDAGAGVRSCLAGSNPLFAVVDQAGDVTAVTVVVGDGSAQVCAGDGTPVTGLRYPLDDAGLKRLTAACTHLARWHGLRDLAPAGSRLNGQVRIEIVPLAAGEKSAPDDRPPAPAPNGLVSLKYDEGNRGALVRCRLINGSNEALHVALFALTDSFECLTHYYEVMPAGAAGGVGLRMTVPASAPSATDYFKVIAAIEDFQPDRWTLPDLLAPAARGSDKLPDPEAEPPPRTADGIDAFWGTTLLKVVTTR